MIEPHIKSGKIAFPKEYMYSALSLLDGDNLINAVMESRKLLAQSDDKNLAKLIFMNFPVDNFDSKKDTLKAFFNKLNLLTPEILDKYHVHGRVYEYFLGFITAKNKGKKGGSQIEDLGQYFSRREIIRYIIAKVAPKLKSNKTVPVMGDFFVGSGGFDTEYIRYMNYKFKNINWGENIKNIYGFDTDRDIIKSARVDILSLTSCFDKLYELNDNIKNVTSTFEHNDGFPTVDFNFTNPPYGGNSAKEEEDKIKISNSGREIKHIAQFGSININTVPDTFKKTKSKPTLISGDNKETIALLHGMGVLKKDGVYAGILKEGVFFDGKFTDLRRELINNYEVMWVCSVPQSDFWNTSTKTSILIFKNSGKRTTNINFCTLDSIVDDNGQFTGIKEINPQDSKIISNFNCDDYSFDMKDGKYMNVSYEELVKENFTLNYKNFIKQNIIVNNGFKVVKLGDVFIWKPKTNHPASDGVESGKYRFYTSGEKIKKCDFLDVDNELSLLIGNGGNGCIYLDDTFSVSDHMFVLQTKDKFLTTYIYYYLKYNWEHLLKFCFNGSTMGNIGKNTLNNYEIPIPESIETVKLYLDFLEPANQSIQSLQSLQSQKEKSICGKIKLLTSFGSNGVEWDEYMFNELTEFQKKTVKYKAADGKISGKYKFYTSSQEKIMYIDDEPMFKDLMLIMGRKGNACAHYDSMFSCEHDDVYVIKCNKLIDTRYMYYYIKSKIEYYDDMMNGSTIGGTSKDFLNKQQIRILKPHLLEQYGLNQDFEFMDKLRNDIQQTLKDQETFTKQMMKLVLDTTHKTSVEKIEEIVEKIEVKVSKPKRKTKEITI